MKNIDLEALKAINNLSDEELANVTGGDDDGAVLTMTSECTLGTVAFICCLNS